jgi:hypothetical protein
MYIYIYIFNITHQNHQEKHIKTLIFIKKIILKTF